MTQAERCVKVAAALAGEALAAGWEVVSHGPGWWDVEGAEAVPVAEQPTASAHLVVRHGLAQSAMACELALTVRAPEKWEKVADRFRGTSVEGETRYGADRWSMRSFVRRGIDCASCWLMAGAEDDTNSYATLPALLAGELARCEASVARAKTLEPVPGTPFSRQPEWFAEAGATLRAGSPVDLTPHGMGTGYRLLPRRTTWGRLAPEALVARLGVRPLYIETFDYD